MYHREAPIDDEKSLTKFLMDYDREQAYAASLIPPKTIYSSSIGECPQKFLWAYSGERYTDWSFNWANELAAEDGDATHDKIQEKQVKSGAATTIPYSFYDPTRQTSFEDRVKKTMEGRDNGLLMPAIEVDLRVHTLAFTPAQRLIYEALGYANIDGKMNKLIDELMLSIRIDSKVKLPTWQREYIVEHKTVDIKYWPLDDKEFNGLNSYQRKKYKENQIRFVKKRKKYRTQTQYQMHFDRESFTGEQHTWAMIYIHKRGGRSKPIEEWVKYDREFVEKSIERDVLPLAEAAKKGVMLPAVIDEDQCPFCPFWSKCNAPGKFPKFRDWSKPKQLANSDLYEEAKLLEESLLKV